MQTAALGSSINICFGEENRLAGTVIFVSGLFQTRTLTDLGHGSWSAKYTYHVDIALVVCEGDIASIRKIWADGKVVYDKDNDIHLAGNNITCTKEEEGFWTPYPYPDGEFVPMSTHMRLESPNGDPNMSSLKGGINEDNFVTIAGFANGENNGSFHVVASFEKDDGTEVAVIANSAVVDEGAGASVTLDQVNAPFDPSIITSVTVYKGNHTQVADPIIESYKGVGEVPGFRGLAYVVIEGFQLEHFGNRVPTFNFMVKESSSPRKVKKTIEFLLERAGWTTADFDVSAIDDDLIVRGWSAAGPSSVVVQIQTLMLAFDITSFERAGKIHFVERGKQDTIAVSSDMLAARILDQAPPAELEVTDSTGYDLPRKVTVKFFQPRKNYQQDTAEYQRIQRASPEAAWTTGIDADVEVVLPMVLSTGEAKQIAKRILWDTWRQRQSARMSLPPSFFHVEEGDTINIDSGSAKIRVHDISRGAIDHIHHQEGILLSADEIDFSSDEAGDDPDGADDDPLYIPPPMTLYIMDISAISDNETETPGYYFGACVTDIEALFQGALLYESIDNVNYEQVNVVPAEAIVMKVETVLADSVALDYFDHENTVDVRCLHGAIATGSTAVLDVLNGANRMLVSGEIIAWTAATSLGDNRYRLSGLLRGLRDTWRAKSIHVANELAVVLDESIQYNGGSTSSCGQLRYWKCVADGGVIADAFPIGPLTLLCSTLRCFAPAEFEATRDGSNDITYDWLRVTRSVARLFIEGAEVPMIPASERYEVDVHDTTDGSFGTIVRTIAVAENSASYTAAEQFSDGLTPGTKYDTRVYQLNDSDARGNAAEGTL